MHAPFTLNRARQRPVAETNERNASAQFSPTPGSVRALRRVSTSKDFVGIAVEGTGFGSPNDIVTYGLKQDGSVVAWGRSFPRKETPLRLRLRMLLSKVGIRMPPPRLN